MADALPFDLPLIGPPFGVSQEVLDQWVALRQNYVKHLPAPCKAVYKLVLRRKNSMRHYHKQFDEELHSAEEIAAARQHHIDQAAVSYHLFCLNHICNTVM